LILRSILKIGIGAVLLPCAASALAQDCRATTWSGTIGDTPISISFDPEGGGAYYYRHAFDDLVLTRRTSFDGYPLQETDSKGNTTGYMRVACVKGVLGGEWRNPSGSRKLPIVGAPTKDYNATRLAAAKLVARKQKPLDGHAVDVVTVEGMPTLETLQIRNPTAAENRVNAILRTSLLDAGTNHLECAAAGRKADASNSWGDEQSVEPVFWRGPVLSLSLSSGGYCGGAHPYHAFENRTFDTARGVELPLESWLDERYGQEVLPGSELGQEIEKLVLRGKAEIDELAERERECAEMEVEHPSKIAAILRQGVAFRYWYPYAASSCSEDYVVPWAAMQLHLSAAGRARLAAMRRR
jgi:hypothetical protein